MGGRQSGLKMARADGVSEPALVEVFQMKTPHVTAARHGKSSITATFRMIPVFPRAHTSSMRMKNRANRLLRLDKIEPFTVKEVIPMCLHRIRARDPTVQRRGRLSRSK